MNEARAPSDAPEGPGSRGLAVFLETFGCQMNDLDSELVRCRLSRLGYRHVTDSRAADIVLFNTCSVRAQAENKALSRVGRFKGKTSAGPVLGVIGCMAERLGRHLLRTYPQIDLLCGPGELDRLPALIEDALARGPRGRTDRFALAGDRARRSTTLAAAEDALEMLDLDRAFDPHRAAAGGRSAYVRITRGCNKFCTYCVVPRTRGAEVHRPPGAIIDECRRLADQGVIEVTLLGQTVNHYLYTHGPAVTAGGREAPQIGPGAAAFTSNGKKTSRARGRRATSFARLLARIHDEVPAIARLRFVTSYPRDFPDEALQVMAESPRLCRYLHVPAQSGSNRVLKLMNRGYTVEQYVDFIDRARSFLPDVCLAGDFIVGFPTEGEEDFQATKRLLERVRYKNSFIFKYSPRPGTPAMERLPDDVPREVKRRRNHELLEVQARIGAAVHRAYVGRTLEVFVEGVSPAQDPPAGSVELRWERPRVQMTGRTRGDLIAVFDLPRGMRPEEVIGRCVPVRVVDSGPLILEGALRALPAGGEGPGSRRQGSRAGGRGPGGTGSQASAPGEVPRRAAGGEQAGGAAGLPILKFQESPQEPS